MSGAGYKFPQAYHHAWLSAHPARTFEWLRERIADGFHIHHVDGDHGNNDPANLILIEGADHIGLHASLRGGVVRWRERQRKPKVAIDDGGAEIYAAKSNDSRAWKDFAKSHFGGVKPYEAIWSDIGLGLQSKARKYAKCNGLVWPPEQRRIPQTHATKL